MADISYLKYKNQKLYIPSDVSRLLNRTHYYVTTKICNGGLVENEHYLILSQSEINELMEQNDSFIWGRGRMKYFITSLGLEFLNKNFKRNEKNMFKRLNEQDNAIRLKTEDGPMTENKQVNFRFDANVTKMLEDLVEFYSDGKYKKVTKTGVMQDLIFKDYQEKISNKNA